jgi:molybdopterin synthase sulfur carrier subunit
MATVLIPAPLRRLTAGLSRVEIAASTVAAVIDGLDMRHPGVRDHLLDEAGDLRSYVNIFVNQTEIRQSAGLQTPVGPSDEIVIIPAMAGGGTRGRRWCL